MLGTIYQFDVLALRSDVAVARGCRPADLKRAFHRASLSLHPDRLGAETDAHRRDEAEELFKALSAAYDVERANEELLVA